MGVWDRFRGWLGMKPKASLDGAQVGRLFRSSSSATVHPDRAIQYDLSTLRARARHLAQNDSTLSGFLETACDNVVGPKGIQLQAKVATRQGELANPTNAEIERGWKSFGERGNCTVDGNLSMVQLQRLVYATKKRDGEVFVRYHIGPEYPHGIAVQLISPDLLDETYDRAPDANGNEIRMGVEVDRFGRPVAYHFFERHPNDRWGSSRQRVRVDASEVDHLYDQKEPGQTRGYSSFAPVLFAASMLKGAIEAEVTLWRAAACQGIRYEAVTDEAVQAWAAALGVGTAEASLPETEALEPGIEKYVTPGWKAVPYDPSVPNTNAAMAGQFFHMVMARGLGVAYGTLTGDLSNANYSSMRAGLLPERDHWAAEQEDLVTQFLTSLYRRWIGIALLRGVVRLDSRLGSQYHDVEFRGRGWSSVDPLKDRQADQIGIQQGTLSRSEIAADEGRDFEDVIAELKHEQEIADAAGVNIQGDAVATAKAHAMTNAENGAGAEKPKALRAIS